MRFQSLVLIPSLLLSALLVLAPGASRAVSLGQDGIGQVHIVPIYSVENGFDTLVNLVSHNHQAASAVRVQFRDRNGEATESFNVYLGRRDSWVFAVTAAEDGAQLVIPDTSCALGEADGELFRVQSGAALSERVGSIEFLEMGTFGTPFELEAVIDNRDCDAVIDEFESGTWEADVNNEVLQPGGWLLVETDLILVEKGTRYNIPSVALQDFRDIPKHGRPGEPYTLADVHDAGTPAGETESIVCRPDCITETWFNPVDAITSVLLGQYFAAEYVVKNETRASSELVVTSPTRAFYDISHPASDPLPVLFINSREGQEVHRGCGMPVVSDFGCVRPVAGVSNNRKSITVIGMNPVDPDAEPSEVSRLLGVDAEKPFQEGQFPFDVETTANVREATVTLAFETYGTPTLISNEGTEYFGNATIGVILNELVNGTLIDEESNLIRANYSVARKMIRIQSNRSP